MLKLYNTLSHQKEEFKSLDPGGKLARIYVCGVTPYDTSHMGHALVAVIFDVLHRYLEYQGYTVEHIQNLTDVDDDIIKRGRRDKIPYDELGRRWDELYRAGLLAINCLPHDKYIPASNAMPQIITMVEKLLAQKNAYQASDGNVYFRAASYPAYSRLSGLSEKEMLLKARDAAADSLADSPGNPAKESELDFILWQKSAEDEPEWDTPWGAGRPGWHIECSAISSSHLGEQFEIHGGGADLIFPHHSSEIAQSESYSGVSPFVGYWMHIAMLYLGGQKMSKSLGNMIMIDDILKTHSVAALRLYLMGTAHYRTPLHFEVSHLDRAEFQVQSIRRAMTATINTSSTLSAETWKQRFLQAVNDDLDLPRAIRVMLELAEVVMEGSTGVEGQRLLRQMTGLLGLPLGK